MQSKILRANLFAICYAQFAMTALLSNSLSSIRWLSAKLTAGRPESETKDAVMSLRRKASFPGQTGLPDGGDDSGYN